MIKVYYVQADRLVQPFGKIQLLCSPEVKASVRVHAYIPIEPSLEKIKTALVLDGSMSMRALYGQDKKNGKNIVRNVARRIGMYLASKVDVERSTHCFYMTTAFNSAVIEEIGELNATNIRTDPFSGPLIHDTDSGTQLLPAVRRFAEICNPYTQLGLCVILTDGKFSDISHVIGYTTELIRQIKRKEKPLIKFVLIGMGNEVDADQLASLDNLIMDPHLDLWDFCFANDLKSLTQLFTALVFPEPFVETVAEYGYVADANDNIVADYRDSGVPTFLNFMLPSGADKFILYLGDDGYRIEQPLHPLLAFKRKLELTN